jgi:hypothetical protein
MYEHWQIRDNGHKADNVNIVMLQAIFLLGPIIIMIQTLSVNIP